MIIFDSMGSRPANDTTGETSTGIASSGRELVATLSKVIDAGVADHRASNDRVGSVKHEQVIGVVKGRLAVLASFQVAQVTVMTDLHAGATVDFLLGVPVRTGGRAALAQVA